MALELREKRSLKIFILYALRAVGCPLEYCDIHDIAVDTELISSFEFADCFAELLEAGNVAEREDGGKKYYELTEQGTRVADSLSEVISRGERAAAVRSARRYLNFTCRGISVSGRVICRSASASAWSSAASDDGAVSGSGTVSDGAGEGGAVSYSFCAEVKDRSGPLMEVELRCASKDEAEVMKYRFGRDPEKLYRTLMDELSDPR